jgi:hypothetical protein
MYGCELFYNPLPLEKGRGEPRPYIGINVGALLAVPI